MKFTSDAFGTVTGDPLLQGQRPTPAPTSATCGPSSGQLLATATFTGETASGWQQVNFATPVAINPNTTYVASYFAPKGHYSQRRRLLLHAARARTPTIGSVDSPPLHALRNTNGVGQRRLLVRRQQHVPDQHLRRRELLGRRRVHPAASRRRPARSTNVTATAGYASATVTWTAPTHGRPGHELHDHAVHRRRPRRRRRR